jgi:hypothetical protein
MMIVLIIILLLSCQRGTAQEFEFEVTINTQQLQSDALDNIVDFVDQVKQYLNSNRWTKDDFGPADRIVCTMSIFFKGSPSTGRYSVQAFIGSQRKIWNARTNKPTEKNSAMLRIFDDSWDFSYTRGAPLTRNEYRFDALTSFLDFYVYMILGFDYDSYESSGGTPHYQRAMNIYNLARSSGGRGWEFPGSGTYSRARLIDELVSERFKDFREALYVYHAEGLDRLASDPASALSKIYSAVESIGKVKKRINQPSVAIKTFFDTKYLELCELFQSHSDDKIYQKLSAIDPSHQKSYEEYQEKRRK